MCQKYCGVNINRANEILRRPDCNSIEIGKLKIEETQLYEWLQHKRQDEI